MKLSFESPGNTLLAAVIMLLLPYTTAFPQPFRTQHYSVEDGLSQTTVRAIVQDRQGFLWFGTADGLNRFDGYSFKVFHQEPQNPTGMEDDNVGALAVDSSGMLWVGTTKGLFRYDAAAGTFRHPASSPPGSDLLTSERIYHLFVDRDGQLWVTGVATSVRLDPRSGQTTVFARPARILFQDPGGMLWACCKDTLLQYDSSSGSFRRFSPHPQWNGTPVLSGFMDREGTVWIATAGLGLFGYDRQTATWNRHSHHRVFPAGVFDNQASSVLEDAEGRLWVGTRDGGLNIFDRRSRTFQRISLPADERGGTRFESVWTLYIDRSGVLWAGYDGSGIVRVVTRPDKFRHVLLPPSGGSMTGDNFLKPIMVDHGGAIWLGTFDKGIRVLDRRTGSVTRYNASQAGPGSLSGNSILALFENQAHTIWVGTHNGLDRFSAGTFRHVSIPEPPAPSRNWKFVTSFCEDSAGTLWIGTRSTLLQLNPARESPALAASSEEKDLEDLNALIECLAAGPDGTIWVGTNGKGLLGFHPLHRTLSRFTADPSNQNSLTHNVVKSILVRPDGILWIATEAGLNRFDPRTGGWKHYTTKDGLANDFIYGLLMDDHGNFWLSTNRGLSRMSGVDSGKPVFRNFTVDDGLQSFEFNTNCYAKAPTGELLFGGVNGFNIFHPDSIPDNPSIPQVVLTGFKKFDQPVDLGADIGSMASVLLRHSESVFSIEYAGLEYTNPARNQYAYMMEGFDAGWNRVGTRREARYTNLDPGRYIFRVKACNNDGVWNEAGVSIRIVIVPPFWHTGWFVGGVSICGVAVLISGIRYLSTRKLKRQIERLEREKAVQDERTKTRERIARDLHDDLASTVGSAGLFVESAKTLLRNDPGAAKDFLDKTTTILTEAEESMSDIVWSVSPTHDTLGSLLSRIRLTTADMCRANGIEYDVDAPSQGLHETLTDEVRRGVYLIFKEAISNAARHSAATKIRVAATVHDGVFALTIEDNGKGISHPVPEHSTKRGHGLRNMAKRAEEMGATFDIRSTPGKGTSIRLSVRMTQTGH